MPQPAALREVRVLSDKEFPIQILHFNFTGFPCTPNDGNFSYAKGHQMYPLHWHEHLELHYIFSGSATSYINQTPYNVVPGDLLIINSNGLHCGFCNELPLQHIVILFDVAELSPELARMNALFRPLIRGDETVCRIMERIHQEDVSNLPGKRQVCKALLLELIVHLLRNYVDKALNDHDALRRKKDLERLNGAAVYIDRHYQEQITNALLAEIACMSESRFIHLFRQSMGVPPLQYVNDIRLRKAMTLLKSSDLSLTSIAGVVGFRDYNNFGRLFRRRFGYTPSQVRRKV